LSSARIAWAICSSQAFWHCSFYEKLGVGILRRAWFNLDLLWMLALLATGMFILLT
jgi:hypothetical protein